MIFITVILSEQQRKSNMGCCKLSPKKRKELCKELGITRQGFHKILKNLAKIGIVTLTDDACTVNLTHAAFKSTEKYYWAKFYKSLLSYTYECDSTGVPITQEVIPTSHDPKRALFEEQLSAIGCQLSPEFKLPESVTKPQEPVTNPEPVTIQGPVTKINNPINSILELEKKLIAQGCKLPEAIRYEWIDGVQVEFSQEEWKRESTQV